MRRFRQETMSEKAYRYRSVAFVVCVPLLLIVFVLLAMPRHPLDPSAGSSSDPFEQSTMEFLTNPATSAGGPGSVNKYAVVFDAGSSGSRVHVYCFGDSLELIPIGDEMELFRQKKPGLSSFSTNPEEGAKSLTTLLDEAINAVPSRQRSETPVRVGATAGLRTLPGTAAQKLLEAVSNLLSESPFKFQSDWVSILDGTQEGAFEWVTINYLLGNIGQDYGKTVGVVDLGGGSVQMAYAISETAAKDSPKPSEGEDVYIKQLNLLGRKYHLYVHSYLHYGLLAVRAEVLKLVQGTESCSCLAGGFNGEYKYGSEQFKAVGSATGADFRKCQQLLVKALNKDHACQHMQCTFGGVWSGGGGDGQKKLFVASFFFDRALQADIIKNPDALEAKLKPADFGRAARQVCAMSLTEIGEKYPSTDENDRPYFCLDLVYQYTLLVDGFAIDREQEITLIKKVKYKNDSVEAAWPLGSAIEAISMK